MNITQLCKRYGLEHYGSLEHVWDAHSADGIVLMQLWHAPNQKLHDHPVAGAQLRVCCFEAAGATDNQADMQEVRTRSIEAVEGGARGFAAMSIPPGESRGVGAWAKYTNLERVFPVLALEREPCGSVFALLGAPVPASELGQEHDNQRGRAPSAVRHPIRTGGRASTPSSH
ncbi:hypothetical protein [Massilia sp.]|uniref:hypothetical protein n=1 Tax=Massilia sp. TaxID=1882437 RepID=UPI0028A12D7D|nr:hypothetical protein [Massilia sp.]